MREDDFQEEKDYYNYHYFIHEFTHFLCDNLDGPGEHPPHGPRFVARLLNLLHAECGFDWRTTLYLASLKFRVGVDYSLLTRNA